MTREEEIIENAYMYESVARDEFRGTVESFKAGAHWADDCPQSPWVPIDGDHPLPEIGEIVLLYYPVEDGGLYLSKRKSVSGKSANNLVYAGGYDEYGFPVMAENMMEAIANLFRIRATYWMPIHEPNKKGDTE